MTFAVHITRKWYGHEEEYHAMNNRDTDRHYVMNRRSALVTAGGLFAAGALAACGTNASSSPASQSASVVPGLEPIADNCLDPTMANQAATYRNIDRQKLGTRVIPRDPNRTSPLPGSGKSLNGLRYTYKGTERTLDSFVADNRISGLLVLKDGAIVHEQYAMGNTETSRWTSMSIAKSVTATLIGAALVDGAIGSLDDPIPQYVPELKDSAYKDNTIRQVLQMVSGVKWVEDGANDPYGDNDIARMFNGVYGNDPSAVMELMRTRPRAAAPGTVFNYSTGEAYVASTLLANATGKTVSDYLSEKIWRPAGMEADGYWMLDNPGGRELGGSCFQATLRDYGRLGQFIMTPPEGVLPKGWRDEAGKPQSPITQYDMYPDDPDHYGYGYYWWCFPPGVVGARGPAPTFMGMGHGGQRLYINPSERVAAVLWSAWPNKQGRDDEFFVVLDGVVNALR
ncbi:serine hydrolase domain-containing protein [Rhodococcus sp. NPDC059968]|uniref:serine hydrolase domain-containing protein n=1 Tax=Rhodococcus sp. NPDC059968 TaxID=3347017 RepID=UPI003671333A